jgi:glucokinase
MTDVLADIGGTHVRFARLRDGALHAPRKIRAGDHESLEDALAAYCAETGDAPGGGLLLALAANPDANGVWTFGNHNRWAIDPALLARAGWRVAQIVNDFAASARGALELAGDQRIVLRAGAELPHEARAIMGPGTGLGLGFMIPLPGGAWHIHRTKGGHMLAATLTDEQHEIIRLAAALRGHSYAPVPEDAVSGRGLPFLYRAVCQRNGREPRFSGERVWEHAGQDADARDTMRLFHEFFGLFAHNAIVTGSAWGGIYLDGGLFNRLREDGLFDLETFHKFMAIDMVPAVRRMLDAVPVYAVNDPFIALRGLAAARREGTPI